METISYKEFIEKVYGILKKHAITGSRLTISDGGRRLEIVFDIGNIAEIRIIVWLLRDKDSNYWEPAIEYNCALGFRSGMDPITTLQVIDINRAIEELVDTLSHCRMDYSVITSTSNYKQYEWGKVKEQE